MVPHKLLLFQALTCLLYQPVRMDCGILYVKLSIIYFTLAHGCIMNIAL